MTYFNIDFDGEWYDPARPVGGCAVYIMPPEAYALYQQWQQTHNATDGLISGIIADWLEDNAGDLEPVHPNPKALQAHIDWMRRRFADPDHNRSRQ